jgi:predicted alpha-1,2-mannosidase
MGGPKQFTNMLDSVFNVPPLYDDSYYGGTIHEIREMQIMNMGNYAHGNQPIQHAIYLYNYSGEPWKAQYWLREVMNRLYLPAPDGYCGDEDNGQTSAWYVFSALGFYPVCPGAGQYVLGSPLFRSATIHLENGKTFTLKAPQNSKDNVYVSSRRLNKSAYPTLFINHEDIMKGGTLECAMDSKPNTNVVFQSQDLPYSFSTPLQ